MDWMGYSLGLVQALAWPVTVGLLGYAFRRQISNRIDALSEMDIWGASFSFGRELSKIEEVLEAEPSLISKSDGKPQLPKPPPSSADVTRFERIADLSPALAVIEAWGAIEEELNRLGLTRGYGDKPVTFLLRRLKEDGLLDRATFNSIDQLRTLRNTAAHLRPADTITIEDAKRFERLSEEVVKRLQLLS